MRIQNYTETKTNYIEINSLYQNRMKNLYLILKICKGKIELFPLVMLGSGH